MSEKQYKNIKEVSKLLNIKEHVIRHWDSIDPKTTKIRFQGLSIRSKGGTRVCFAGFMYRKKAVGCWMRVSKGSANKNGGKRTASALPPRCALFPRVADLAPSDKPPDPVST